MKFHRISKGELTAAKRIAVRAGVLDHRWITIPQLREAGDIHGGSSLSSLSRTYIPNRNMIFYSLAASYAEEVGSNYIIGGHNADDERLFADTRPEFFKNFQLTLWSASRILLEQRTTVLRPLQHMTKSEVVAKASELGVPLEMTWSCHRVGSKPCWKCDGCMGRASAFADAGVRDPLRRFWTQKV